jgi:glycerol-3-phosphate dehydrogenase
MVKGSHIILPRLFEHDRAYIFQNSDNRIVFAIPYEQDFTLIGTTDEDFEGDPATAEISRKEIGYLIDAVNGYFKTEISAEDVVTTYAGVRPLYDDGASAAQSATRDYVLKLQGTGNEAPLLNIFGGKITTYRRLAEAALEKLEASLGTLGQPWTKESHLPGGDFSWDGAEQLASDLCRDFPFLERKLAQRLVRAYGTRARDLLGKARSLQDLGQHFGADLYEAEVVYLMDREWACSARDVVWRRSKLVLRMTREEQAALDDWMSRRRATSRGDAAE